MESPKEKHQFTRDGVHYFCHSRSGGVSAGGDAMPMVSMWFAIRNRALETERYVCDCTFDEFNSAATTSRFEDTVVREMSRQLGAPT